MDNNKPITETDKDIQSVSKSDFTDRSIVTLKYAKIQCLLKRREKLKHFTSVFVAFRFFPAITCDFKSTVPMMTSDFEKK
ncbi:hypothetical protein T12_4814 [Trichinella patagoniensis]|uniref:Uncharacterized protein n=1 Tax=Trichinella patagoniensis TaxID=990121 RepID=A0A0V0ZEN7_9BILA|nr:hypothetical protein T12_4814 [Trichinella patagoniensis]